ncbi:MAG TPA: radical SAM protein, partial [Bacteroidetes bacterium]|nr:radical SAM protein [Bacteroidota bacterium]
MAKKHYTIPVFIPELACPFQCVFCNQRKITGRQFIPDDSEIIRTIDEHLLSFKEKERNVEIGFFGGSFTGIPIEQQAHYLKLVRPYFKKREITGIRLSTRPDYINPRVLDLLKQWDVGTIELGAQSFDEDVLKQSFRGHTARQTEKAAKAILDYGFDLGLQMMIGLPGDTLEKTINTAKRIVELGASDTRIYPTVVIKDTALYQWYKNGEYQPLSLEEAVDWVKKILPVFEEAGIKIIRVGLHPSEGLLSGEELIAGPFHPSFRELVLTEIWRDLLTTIPETKKQDHIEIRVPPGQINYAIGYNGKNR